MEHGPTCPTVKSIEYFEDGERVKKVEFKVAADYATVFTSSHIPWPILPSPSNAPQPNYPITTMVGNNPDGSPRYVDMRSQGG